jgi:Na+/citrate or Na+/malate symporter
LISAGVRAAVAAAMTGIALGSRAPDPLMLAGIAVVAGGLAAGLSARPDPAQRTGQATPRAYSAKVPAAEGP